MSRASCSKATGEEAPHFFLLGMRLLREVGLFVVLTAAAKTTCGPVWPLTTRAASRCPQEGQSPCGAWRGGYGCSRSFLVPCAEGLAGLRQLLVTEGKWRSGPGSQPQPCHCVDVGVPRGLFWKLQSICMIGP